jgi:hypothetical protein
MMPEWLFQLFTAGAGAASVYAAIRADLARLLEKAEQAGKSADEAHSRIDDILLKRRG